MSEKVVGGTLATAPHSMYNIPRTCWTCIKHTLVLSGLTTCEHIDTYNHTKMGTEPCDRYELNAVWIMADWFYPSGKKVEA